MKLRLNKSRDPIRRFNSVIGLNLDEVNLSGIDLTGDWFTKKLYINPKAMIKLVKKAINGDKFSINALESLQSLYESNLPELLKLSREGKL